DGRAPTAGATAQGSLSVPVRSGGAATEGVPQHGWELAHWAVAQSEVLGIDEVAYAGRVWKAGSGWRTESGKAGTTEVRMRFVH
ncbi:hypothetical protein G3I76_05055, partial [Streptomyces sp. SID11233]|nr:hypothetical protein [Streptomyces sp. SID11233]